MTPGNTDDLRDLEAALSEALRADAARITPTDRLAAIQAATAYDVPARRRGPRLLTLVAAAAAAAVVGSVASGQWLASGETGTPGGTVSLTGPATPGVTTPGSPTTTAGQQTIGPSALPVYFPAPTDDTSRQTWLLTRTFVTPKPGTGTDPASRIAAALTWAMTSTSANPISDLEPPWADMDVEHVGVADDLITITLANGGTAGRWPAQVEQSVISMFVWTAQAVLGHGRVPVTFTLADGNDTLFGQFPASDRYDRPASDHLSGVVAPVWIDVPGIDQVVPAGTPVSVHGLALDASTALSWRLQDANGMTDVATGTTTTDATRPQASFAFTLEALPVGAYYLTISAPGQSMSLDGRSAGTTAFFRVR